MAKRIGEFLVSIGLMRDEQVKAVLALQQAGDKRPFGEIALSLGFIGNDSVRRYADYADTQKGAAK